MVEDAVRYPSSVDWSKVASLLVAASPGDGSFIAKSDHFGYGDSAGSSLWCQGFGQAKWRASGSDEGYLRPRLDCRVVRESIEGGDLWIELLDGDFVLEKNRFVLFEEKTLDGSGWMQDDVVASAGASEEVEHEIASFESAAKKVQSDDPQEQAYAAAAPAEARFEAEADEAAFMLEELRVAPAVGRKAIFDWSIGLEIIWLMSSVAPATLPPVCVRQAKFRGPFEPDQVSTEPAAFASRAFPVVQQDKIRSADDWQKDQGPQVFRQLVLPFGGTGSVWAYLRITDKICFLTLVLVFLPAAHFVDDFYYSQPSRSSVPNVSSAAAATTRAFIFWLEAMAQIACLMIASQVTKKDLATRGCHKKDPEFDQAWELLFELTKKPMDPDKPLSEKLVNLLALHPVAHPHSPYDDETPKTVLWDLMHSLPAEQPGPGQDDLDFSPVRKDGQDAGMSFVTGVTTPPSSLDGPSSASLASEILKLLLPAAFWYWQIQPPSAVVEMGLLFSKIWTRMIGSKEM
ncbi:unnamed protein product, partial [Symbiodinium microadriaticum]